MLVVPDDVQCFKTAVRLFPTLVSVQLRQDGETALHIATLHDRAEVAAMLIGKGASIEALNKVGTICIHTAAGQ